MSILMEFSFFVVQVIKQIISGMSYDKLNVFHWHITDTHSFPFYSRRVPQLTMHGAYSPRQVYTPEDVRDIVEYARLRCDDVDKNPLCLSSNHLVLGACGFSQSSMRQLTLAMVGNLGNRRERENLPCV